MYTTAVTSAKLTYLTLLKWIVNNVLVVCE